LWLKVDVYYASEYDLQDKYPWDVTRQTRLMGQYKAAGRINDAYDRAIRVDVASHTAYSTSIEWHRCVCEILTVSVVFYADWFMLNDFDELIFICSWLCVV
jgi:hypothetical protein